MVWAWLVACGAWVPLSAQASQAPRAPVPARSRQPATWQVAVALAIGKGTVEERYTLRTERLAKDVWSFSTVRSEKIVDAEDGSSRAWSSDDPHPGDPWPYVLQQAVASVPAAVRLVDGRPTELVDPEGWSGAARAAMAGAGLPSEAVATGASLVDASGVVSDLARAFPGLPRDGRLVAEERIAGVDAIREESCEDLEDGEIHRYRCTGSARAADGSDRLTGCDTWTEVVADRDGMVWMESAFGGTLVTRDGAGRASALPIAGHRRAQREAAAGPGERVPG